MPDLKAHLRQRLQDAYPSLGDPDVPIILHHDRVYQHATAHINYTSYDLQREQDIIHPSVGKSDILVHTPSVEEHIWHPWSYARGTVDPKYAGWSACDTPLGHRTPLPLVSSIWRTSFVPST